MFRLDVIQWQGLVDLIVLTAAIYWILHMARQTHVLRLFIGIGALLLGGSLARQLELIITAWILHATGIGAVVLLIVVYHSEIRHALTRLDPLNRFVQTAAKEQTSDRVAISEAVFSLARARLGALIVLARNNSMENMLTGGVILDGRISREILEAVFRKVSPLHDGALVIVNGRITRVGVFLPLTSREDLAVHYGTRHRAALGLSEQSDTLVIIVSEERGEVSIAYRKTIQLVRDVDELVDRMRQYDYMMSLTPTARLNRRIFGDLRLKFSALGISMAIWSLVFMTGTSERMISVPIEFDNVPAGLEVTETTPSSLSVQLRAAQRLFATLDESGLVVHIDINKLKAGQHTIPVQAKDLSLPPGMIFENATPPELQIRLVSMESAASHSKNLEPPEIIRK